MKREILFRGKDKATDQWVYGDYTHNEGLNTHYISRNVNNTSRKAWEVDPNTIGQYTGLKDKNGNEIFEGDIIKTPRGFIGEVVFGRAEEECTHRLFRRMVTDVFTTYGWVFKRADGFTIAIDDEILQGELIGNVTDNPELMK